MITLKTDAWKEMLEIKMPQNTNAFKSKSGNKKLASTINENTWKCNKMFNK